MSGRRHVATHDGVRLDQVHHVSRPAPAALDLHETGLLVQGEGLVGGDPDVGVAPATDEPERVAEPQLVDVDVAERKTWPEEGLSVRWASAVGREGTATACTRQLEGANAEVFEPEDVAEQRVENNRGRAGGGADGGGVGGHDLSVGIRR